MFKRLKTIIVFLLLLTQSFAQEKKEKDYIRTLQTYIDSYLESVPPVTDSLIAASDYLIAFSDDSLIRSHITGYLYNKFRSSLVMGMESVAVYIGKEYYLNGRVKPANEDEKFLISLFVRLNENSLIGMKAPELRLPDQNGDTLSLRNLQSTYTLVYFYDDKCSRCKTELPVMKEILRQFEFLDISVYAVYTQASGEDFKNSAGEILSAFNDISGAADTSVKWHFVWDPGFESGFHLLYNVLSTPQLFLLDKDQKIIGRNLESRSLRELLSAETARLNNLSPVTANFLWSYLPLFNLKDTSELRSAFEPLFEHSSGQKDPGLYRTLFLEMFEYLAASGVDSLEDAAVWLGENYIENRRELWWDNSIPEIHVPKVISRIRTNRPGEVANDLYLADKRGKISTLSSHRGKKFTLLFFYTQECPVCSLATEQLKDIYKTLRKRRVKIVGIDIMGEEKDFVNYLKKNRIKWEALFPPSNQRQELYYKYIANRIPAVYLLDNNWRIVARGIDINTLEKLTK